MADLYRMEMPLTSRPGARQRASSMKVHLRALLLSPPSLADPTAGTPAASSSPTCTNTHTSITNCPFTDLALFLVRTQITSSEHYFLHKGRLSLVSPTP